LRSLQLHQNLRKRQLHNKRSNLIVGITGGIGSGKSTVCLIFELFNIPVYNSDEKAKFLMNSSPNLIQSIQANFGVEMYVNGALNKSKLADKVFSNPDALSQLNALVHPAVGRDFDEWQDRFDNAILLKEAAILIESGAHKKCDKVIVVDAPDELRVKRVMTRDQVSEKEVRERMNRQLNREDRLKFADYIIDNSGAELLIPQVQKIISDLN
jgi:dephospho-CoA kinase